MSFLFFSYFIMFFKFYSLVIQCHFYLFSYISIVFIINFLKFVLMLNVEIISNSFIIHIFICIILLF